MNFGSRIANWMDRNLKFLSNKFSGGMPDIKVQESEVVNMCVKFSVQYLENKSTIVRSTQYAVRRTPVENHTSPYDLNRLESCLDVRGKRGKIQLNITVGHLNLCLEGNRLFIFKKSSTFLPFVGEKLFFLTNYLNNASRKNRT